MSTLARELFFYSREEFQNSCQHELYLLMGILFIMTVRSSVPDGHPRLNVATINLVVNICFSQRLVDSPQKSADGALLAGNIS